MGKRVSSSAGCWWQAGTRTAAALLFAGLLASLTLQSATAQLLLSGSEIAGVVFPAPSNLWISDAQRSQASALENASELLERACGATEFHIWDAIGGERDAVRMRMDTAFAEAGWSLGVNTISPGGERIYLATRAEEELIMVWLPRSEAIGLLLCEVTGPRTAEAEPIQLPDPAQQLTPIPRPRPDPNAPVILPVEPAAEETPPAGDPAGAVSGPALEAAPADPNDGAVGGIINPVQQRTNAGIPVTEEPEDEPGPGFSIWLLLVAAVLAIGAFLMLRWARSNALALASASWQPALATVIYSDVASENTTDRKGRVRTRYVPVIAYEYEVDGTAHQAARMRFRDISVADQTAAAEIADRFPVGAGIEIRYDPANPSEATIETEPSGIDYRIISGIALSVLAVAALISALG